MELIKFVSRRSRLGEITYDVLNLVYAGLLLALVITFDPPVLAYVLVLLSKWRVFAVRPRFWLANVQSNLIDTIVGLSVVTLMWLASGNEWTQIAMAVLFAGWLVIVKPRSKIRWVLAQAGVGQFLGLMALFSVSYQLPAIIVVAGASIIGYAAARHALTAHKTESDRMLLSLTWVFVVAELAWLSYHWTIAYVLGAQLAIPQIAIITTLIGFAAVKIYGAYENDGKIEFAELRWPVLFAALILVLLLGRFSGLDISQF